MFTVLSHTRKSNLYLITALAVVVLILTSFAFMPAMTASKQASIPVTGNSEVTSDYFLRHPELNISAPAVEINSDFSLRHPEWTLGIQDTGISVTGIFEGSDYFQRHSEMSLPAASAADLSDYSARHVELRPAEPSTDLSDYFLRH